MPHRAAHARCRPGGAGDLPRRTGCRAVPARRHPPFPAGGGRRRLPAPDVAGQHRHQPRRLWRADRRLRESLSANPGVDSIERSSPKRQPTRLRQMPAARRELKRSADGRGFWAAPHTPRTLRAHVYLKDGQRERARPLIDAALANNRRTIDEAIATGYWDEKFPTVDPAARRSARRPALHRRHGAHCGRCGRDAPARWAISIAGAGSAGTKSVDMSLTAEWGPRVLGQPRCRLEGSRVTRTSGCFVGAFTHRKTAMATGSPSCVVMSVQTCARCRLGRRGHSRSLGFQAGDAGA